MLAIGVAATLSMWALEPCDGHTTHKLRQEYFLMLTDRVYVWAPDVNSTGSTGWEPFEVRVIIGRYRKPLLLRSSLLRESDLVKALSGQRDVETVKFKVQGSRTGRGGSSLGELTVRNGERSDSITIRITKVVPVRGRSGDHLYLSCSMAR